MKRVLKCPRCERTHPFEVGRLFCDQDGTRLIVIDHSDAMPGAQGKFGLRGANMFALVLILVGIGGIVAALWNGQEKRRSGNGATPSVSAAPEDAGLATELEDTKPTDPLLRCYGSRMPKLPSGANNDASKPLSEIESVVEDASRVAAGALSDRGNDAEDAALGEAIFKKMTKKTKGAFDRKLTSDVNALVRKLQVNATRKGRIAYRARVIDDDHPNAYALPGGLIVVTKPLMKVLSDESQLASVISHEIAHTELRHMDDVLRIPDFANDVGSVFFGRTAGRVAGGVATRVLGATKALYDQRQEFESDRYGLCLSYLAGFNPAMATNALERVDADSGEADENKRPDDVGSLQIAYDIIYTHPPTKERVQYLRTLNRHLITR